MRILNSNSEIPVNQFNGFKYFPVFILQGTKCKLSESLDKVRRLLSVKVCPPHAGGLAPTFPSAGTGICKGKPVTRYELSMVLPVYRF